LNGKGQYDLWLRALVSNDADFIQELMIVRTYNAKMNLNMHLEKLTKVDTFRKAQDH
jgi:hypothetical protein